MLTGYTNFIGLVFAGGALLSFAVSSAAQSVSGTQANPSGPFSASLERRRAEQDLRALPQRIRETRQQNFKDPKVLQQMNEDFLKLQTIRVAMAKTFASGALLTSAQLNESSEDVKRRAIRLRSMLALSEDPKEIDISPLSAISIESLNDRAFQLCLEISRFTENRMFRTNGVVTVKQVTEAAKALDTVIALAGAVQKESSRVR
ncbi:MAG: hypothetical protein ABIR33_03150 [Pyrinomonadaceae bacterium]